MPVWYVDRGPEADVIVSSRVRLARNFRDYPFPGRMNNEQAKEIINICKNAVPDSNKDAVNGFSFISVNDLNVVERQAMVEKHLISPEMLKDDRARSNTCEQR